MDSSPLAVPSTSDFAPATSKESFFIQATIECRFTLKRIRDMTRTYSQMHRQINTQNTAHSFGQFAQRVEFSFTNEVILGSSPLQVN